MLGAISTVTEKCTKSQAPPLTSRLRHTFDNVDYAVHPDLPVGAGVRPIPNQRTETCFRTGLIYALITVSYAPLILYTPKPGEQQVHIDKDTGSWITKKLGCGPSFVLKVTKFVKKPEVRHVCAFVYTLGCLMQGIAMYSIYTAMLTRLGSEWADAVAVTVIYGVLMLVYLVAFITAIYELRPSVRIDRSKTGRLTKAYPKFCKRYGMRPEGSNETFDSSVNQTRLASDLKPR